jgi:hypothetical protein
LGTAAVNQLDSLVVPAAFCDAHIPWVEKAHHDKLETAIRSDQIKA